jgi:squalene cyclase
MNLWLQKVQESAQLWAKQVSAVSLSDWQDAMLNKGVGRIAAGVTSAQSKKTAQITKLLDAVDNAAAAARALPKGTLEQNIQRAVTFMQNMSANAPRKKG